MTQTSSRRVHPQIDSNHQLPVYYAFEVCDPLPKLNPSRCWLSLFVTDERRQAKCISFFVRAQPIVNTLFVINIYIVSISNVYANISLAVWSNSLLFIVTVLAACCWLPTFSIDMGNLTMRTYEFWYLTALNTGTQALYIQMARDIRVLFFFMAFVGYQAVYFSDANLYSRRHELLLLLFASPSIILLVGATQVDLFSRNTHTTIRIGDAVLKDSDVALGTLVISAIFVLVKVAKAKDLILGKKHALKVHVLHMYHATVRLRQQSEVVKPKMPPQSKERDVQLCVSQFRVPLLDSSRIVWPQLRPFLFTRRHRFLIQTSGYVGSLLTAALLFSVASGYKLHAHRIEHQVLVFLAYFLTFFHTGTYAACTQIDMVRQIITSDDSFVSQVQLCVIMVCACDVVNWDFRILLIFSTVLWGTLNLYMDAVMPNMRLCLGFQQWFAKLIAWFNTYCTIALIFWFFIKSSHGNISDSVVFSFRISANRKPVEFHVSTILASQLLGALFWSLRFTYRETARPTDVLKLIEATLYYRLPKNVYHGIAQIPVSGPPVAHMPGGHSK